MPLVRSRDAVGNIVGVVLAIAALGTVAELGRATKSETKPPLAPSRGVSSFSSIGDPG